MKWSIVGVVVIGAAAIIGTTAANRGPRPVEVRVEAVEQRDLVASVTASGQVQPRTKVDVAADISGRIVRLAVKEGQMVRRGDFLLQIDPEQYEAAVQRSEAALSSAKAQEAQTRANFIQAQRNYQRNEEIRKSNPQLVSDVDLEQTKTQMEVQQALLEAATHNVAQAEASVRDAKTSLAKTTILAPMSGRITRLVVEQGETAVPGTFNKDAATLLTISDMAVLETIVKVDETDVARIALGDSALVQIDAFPDTTFVGKVVEISHSSVRGAAAGGTTEQAVDYEVRVQLVNPPGETRPDFSATAKIVTDIRNQVLSIPIIALTVRENEAVGADTAVALGRGGTTPAREVGRRDVEGVFMVGTDNKVTFRPVKVGIAGDKYFEVISGLQSGERIVGGTYQAIRELRDGTLIREATPTPTPGAKDTKS
ncbi:MAG TPA: efflux RND transporter periplasmic adaptor subunit [Gemmatimonadaceae bacterium]|nr:efflux RND transporter periplasmic adaptor subunit [Gemmatimonadaceae bacterium]